MTSLWSEPPAVISKDADAFEFLLCSFTVSLTPIMPHFVVFVSDRFTDVERHVAQFNDTRHTIEFCVVWEATTRELGRTAFAHHLVWPLHVLVVVPSVLDLFTWDEELHLFIPFFVTPDAAVAAFEVVLQEVVANCFAPRVPCQLVFADLVGLDTFAWLDVVGTHQVQELVLAVIPRVNFIINRLNVWNGAGILPFGRQVHTFRQAVDGVVTIHDYRTLVDGYFPGVRQQRRWARALIELLEDDMEGVLPN